MVSELFDPTAWEPVAGFDFQDITYHRAVDQGTVRIAFDRPEIRNAFRPATVDELYRAFDHARQWSDVGCVLLTGNGPSPTITDSQASVTPAKITSAPRRPSVIATSTIGSR